MKINRNTFWTENFFDRLVKLGVTTVCISPGSRSTPLTLSAASNKKLRSFVSIDERSSAFFALGFAKASGKPVVVVTTSGTATAELYPAIIEAYQQRIPLIVCTADRPPELVGKGANQTINQDNLYSNHIRFYKNAELPSASASEVKRIRKLAEEAYLKSLEGPVHINFPFQKPFEPESYTDEFSNQSLKLIENLKSKEKILYEAEQKIDKILYKEILTAMRNAQRGLIVVGPMKFDNNEKKKILSLAEKLNYPVIADACSQFRFGNKSGNVITSYEVFLRNNDFIKLNTPDVILQFGSTPSSKAIEIFFGKIKTKRYVINARGDIYDPWNSASGVFKCSPTLFCEIVKSDIQKGFKLQGKNYLKNFINTEEICQKEKERIIYQSAFPNEGRIIPEILKIIPANTQIMISNSMPVRDFDYFAEKTDKNIVIHSNRGASGIDGIISTALGIRKSSNKPVLLITGDMAFYYDLNALLTANKYKIPLVIVLINNNGGGIFGMLPVSGYGRKYREYFLSPHNLDFSTIIKGFNGKHKLIKNWKDLQKSVNKALNEKQFTVLEIKTDIETSVDLRKKYIKGTGKIISRKLNES